VREIKFRAWDKEAQHMIVDSPICMAGIMRDKIGKKRDFNGNLLAEKYILMQYTGSNHKNGKEVYEGDILKTIGDKVFPPVKFYNGGFACGAQLCIPAFTENCYIVGNKYMDDVAK
jgi:uncharacterized phage protein (TIGR01671 family)